MNAGGAELRFPSGYREIAGGNQLAPGGSSDAFHHCDDRLGQAGDVHG